MKQKTKKLICFFLSFILVFEMFPILPRAEAGIAIDESNFPDEIFREFIRKYDTDQDGYFSESELNGVYSIQCGNNSITSLKGIEYFTKLDYLYCSSTQVTSLDLSKNTSLITLQCWYNPLTSINVTGCTKLRILDCPGNQISSLDISNNPELEQLNCYDNQLTSLDISNNPELKVLHCYNNQLESLNISNNPALESLSCYENPISSLDLRDTPFLKSTVVEGKWDRDQSYNYFIYGDYNLSVDKNVELTTGFINLGIKIDDVNFPDERFQDFVRQFDTDHDGFYTYDYLSQKELDAVQKLDIINYSITSLKGIEFFTALTDLNCCNNWIASLDVSKNTVLITLDCSCNSLSSLDVSHNTELSTLNCSCNRLTSLDINTNNALINLSCFGNQITVLDIQTLPSLRDAVIDGEVEKHDSYVRFYNNNGSLEADREVLLNTGNNPSGVRICKANFPDENFRKLVWEYDTEQDDYYSFGYLSDKEIAAVKEINCEFKGIASLQGIEYFPRLESLICNNSNLTSLDLSKNAGLKYLNCCETPLASLDLGKNPNLTELICDNTQLTSLNVNECTALTTLSCYDVPLTSLNVNKCTSLTTLSCQKTQLISLDVSGCKALTNLYCGNTPLTSLDVSDCVALTNLYCENTSLTSLNVHGCKALVYLNCSNARLTSLDISGCTSLKNVYCSDNQLVSLNLNEEITHLYCSGNKLDSLDIQDAPNLMDVYLHGKITESEGVITYAIQYSYYSYKYILQVDSDVLVVSSAFPGKIEINEANFSDEIFREFVEQYDLDKDGYLNDRERGDINEIVIPEQSSIKSLKGIEFFQKLQRLTFHNNPYLSSVDLSMNTALTSLICSSCLLHSLDVSKNTALQYLYCSGNRLTMLDTGNNRFLRQLYCSDNKLTSLDISKNTLLDSLNCSENMLTSLDTSKNEALSWLVCSENQLASLDVSKNPALSELYCNDNQLTELTIGNTRIEKIQCQNNQLIQLDVTGDSALRSLNCEQNKLLSLDMSKNIRLISLICSSNQLASLNISNTTLNELQCYENQFEILDLRGVQCLIAAVVDGTRTDFGTTSWYVDSGSGYYYRLIVDSDVLLVTDDLAEDGLVINETHFPDIRFRKNIRQYDTNKDNALNNAEIAAVTEIDCSGKDILSLQGIEYFTSLVSLNCGNNRLTELNVDQNTVLKTLICENNMLTRLDISKNTALENIDCSENQLISLDVSQNSSVQSVRCAGNHLTELLLPKGYSLSVLDCSDNQITELDILKNPFIEYLDCSGNLLTRLNLKDKYCLNTLYCMHNGIKVLDFSETNGYLQSASWMTGTYYEDYCEYLNGSYCIRADIDVIFLPEGNPFKDVKEGKFYYVPVMWAYTRDPQVTGGTDAEHFSPSDTCTRAQVVTFLWRAKGCPKPKTTKNPFKDVKQGKFYYEAVLWAVENNITTGTSTTTFSPNDPCSRGQVVTFLWRTEGMPAPGVTSTDFTDVKEGKYYYEAMLWAVENNITTGTSPTTFEPNSLCNRGQVVTFLYRDIFGNN